jgi:hypothetical protein
MSPSRRGTADRELKAMSTILRAFEGLDGESIQRVLDYVMGRLSIDLPTRGAFPTAVSTNTAPDGAERRQVSIRDLKNEKQPSTSNQMAALVAYYLSELAPVAERKDTVSTADLEKYYKQAGFRLPSALHKTLRNATASGYFDAISSGRYRLNPVGYNLVVHGLPRGGEAHPAPRPSAKKKAKKQTPKR